MSLGEKIKLNRTKLKLTQQELAAQLHVSRQTISNWEVERSYPDIDSLIALSDLFELSLDNLLKEDAKMVASLKKRSFWDMLYYVLIVCLGIGSIITLGIDLIINHQLSWSLISGVSCLLAGVFLTFFKFSKSHHLIHASLGSSVVLYLLVFVIYWTVGTIELSTMVTLVSLWLVFYGLIVCLIEISKLGFWWIVIVTIVLSWPFEFATKFWLKEPLFNTPSILIDLTILGILMCLIFVDKFQLDKLRMNSWLSHYRNWSQRKKEL